MMVMSGWQSNTDHSGMTKNPEYRGYRSPPEIIARAVWLYHRFTLSLRDVEQFLAERGITVSYQTIRQWCRKVGPHYARKINKLLGPRGERWFLDEVVVSSQGQRFPSVHAQCNNLFRPGRHLLGTTNYRVMRESAFQTSSQVTCAH